MSDVTLHDKITAMPKILEAARVLWLWGVQTERPDETLMRYVRQNPDVQAHVNAVGKTRE